MPKAIENDAAIDARIRHTPRRTEARTHNVMADKGNKDKWHEAEALIFCTELELLLGEYKRHEIAYAVNHQQGVEANYVGEFLEQNHALIVKEIQKRLRLPLGLIEDCLSQFSNVMRAQLANSECINPYTAESTGFSALSFLDKKAFHPIPKSKSSQKKKKKSLKKGKQRPIYHKGELYPSVRQAALQTGDNYNTLKHSSRQKINSI
jgi:hypothetical protein